jgi:cbb3-type cytochrome oxidase maturation protein
MNALFLVLPLALLIAAGAVLAFAWSVRSGQLDDLDTPPRRLLLDEEQHRARIAPPREGARKNCVDPIATVDQ